MKNLCLFYYSLQEMGSRHAKYGLSFTMMKNFGMRYRTAGENIAAGQRTPQEVVNAWMNSQAIVPIF